MRISRLSALAVMATLALAPVANAMPQDTTGHAAPYTWTQQQDLAHLPHRKGEHNQRGDQGSDVHHSSFVCCQTV